MMKKITPSILSFLAICIALNFIGANIALLLRLPVYLDTFGTAMASLILGPLAGAAVAFSSALIGWLTTDIYALYYSPVAIIFAVFLGFIFKNTDRLQPSLIWKSLLVTLPGTAVSSTITILLGGITSSGSSIILQLLQGLGLSLEVSATLVQLLTDYADRTIVIAVCLATLPQLKKANPRLFARAKEA